MSVCSLVSVRMGIVLTPEGATVVSAIAATYWMPLMGSASVSMELSDAKLLAERTLVMGIRQGNHAAQPQPSVIH